MTLVSFFSADFVYRLVNDKIKPPNPNKYWKIYTRDNKPINKKSQQLYVCVAGADQTESLRQMVHIQLLK